MCSILHETPIWLELEMRLNGHTFYLSLKEDDFVNSPARLAELHKFVSYFLRDKKSSDDDDATTCTMDDCFDWALAPLLPCLDDLAPVPPPMTKVTLQDYFAGDDYQCEISAVDDELVADYAVKDTGENFWRFGGDPNGEIFADNSFRTVRPGDVTILTPTSDLLDRTPQSVSVEGQEFCIDLCRYKDARSMTESITMYEDILLANFPPNIRIRGLQGIIVDESSQLPRGFLFAPHLEAIASVQFTRAVSAASKRKWIRQLREAVAALHEADILWKDINIWSAFIDRQDNLWIGGFGDGYDPRWVDIDKRGTKDGDLEAMAGLIDWITKMRTDALPSKL